VSAAGSADGEAEKSRKVNRIQGQNSNPTIWSLRTLGE
jgi:hypothetical protein